MPWRRFAAACLLLLAATPARADLSLLFSNVGASNIVDVGYENVGGWLATTYGLDKSNPACVTGCTVLPALERAVGQIAGNNANGLFVPTAGIPPTQALTNFAAVPNGGGTATGSFSVPGDLPQNTAVPFTLSRTGNVISYSLGSAGGNQRTWTSDAQSYFGAVDTLQFRLRSAGTTVNTPTTLLEIGNLVYSDMAVTGQSLGTLSASNGDVRIALFGGVSGDFTLTGTYLLNWTGSTRPTGWNSQVKALDLPPPVTVPEPASLALLATGLAALAWRRKSKAFSF